MARVTATEMRAALRDFADPKISAHSARFFRSGKGEYGEGDRFLGIRVPVVRKQVREFRDAPLRAVIAMMATYHYIKQGDYSDALCLARLLRDDEHDLIHKVVGWMLREIGNRDRSVEEAYLKKHYRKMPRTMLRYAIEKFPETRRRAYLDGTI